MRTIIRRRDVNTNARNIVQLAVDKGYDYEEIANKCQVSLGTVKRWLATGRADSKKIKVLESEIGQTYLTAESVGDIIIDIYKMRKRRFRIKRIELKRIAGRSNLREKFADQLSQYLLDQGYHMIESVDGDDDFFIIIRFGQLLTHVKDYLQKPEINRYYKELASDIDDGDDDNE